MSYQRAPAQTGMGRRPKRSFRLAGQSWMHRATDSPEMEQSGIEGVTGGRCGAVRVKQQTLVLTAAGFDNNPLPVAMRLGATPVSIPNTMVKT